MCTISMYVDFDRLKEKLSRPFESSTLRVMTIPHLGLKKVQGLIKQNRFELWDC